MSYETGSSSGAADLLSKFSVFAVSQGWTANRDSAVGAGRELCISKGSAYFNFRAWQNETVVVNGTSAGNKYGITVNGSDGYSGGANVHRQPGYPVRASSTLGDECVALFPMVTTTGPFVAYHFFAPDSKTLYAEIEMTSGAFMRFGCGSLDLFNPSAPGGGRFCYASTGGHVTNSMVAGPGSWLAAGTDNISYQMEHVPFRGASLGSSSQYMCGSMVRINEGGVDNWANGNFSSNGVTLDRMASGGFNHDGVLGVLSPSPLNGRSILLPCTISLKIGSSFFSPIGTLPGIRFAVINQYNPGDEFTFGPDTWKIFPWYQKGGIGYNRAIVHLKV
jgi:hypothetical protein